MWRLRGFTPDFINTVVLAWYRQQSEAVREAFITRMEFLLAQPPAVWQRPYVGTLRSECRGLYEIRFEVNNVQHRPIGYYSAQLEFTILAFATERDSEFDPREICATAQRRKRLIEQDRRYAREVTFEE